MAVELARGPGYMQIGRQMARANEQMQKGFFEYSPAKCWIPLVNLYEAEDAYHVCVELAGVDKEKIDIQVNGCLLQLRGRREAPLPDTESKCRVHLMEIDHGNFTRDVELPKDAEVMSITARHENGLLWIIAPKKERTLKKNAE
jgi:HSP20 family protein